MRTLWIALCAAPLVGCGLDAAGLAADESLGDDATGTDTAIAVDSRVDTFVEDTGAPDVEDTSLVDDGVDTAVDTAVDTPPVDACTESACGSPLPTGAKRMALVDRAIACPAGFKSTDVYEATSGNGCGCSCATTTQPTCPATGGLVTAYGDGGSCGSAGLTLSPLGSGTCTALGTSGTTHTNFKGTAPPGYGGTCSTTPVVDKNAVARPRRLCEPLPGTCAGPMCGAPFDECIEWGGTCPTNFPNARTIGNDVTLSCPYCGCSVTPICTGQLTLFGGTTCTGTAVTKVAVNNTCVSSAVGSVGSYQYVPDAAGSTCSPTFNYAAGTRTMVVQRNLCCR